MSGGTCYSGTRSDGVIRIVLHGAAGRMGRIVSEKIASDPGMSLSAGVDCSGADGFLPSLSAFSGEADLIIDFSHHSATRELLEFAVARSLPVLIATTGQTEEELAMIREAAEKIPVFYSSNMSLGVALLCDLAKKAAAAMPDADIEIVETHHNRKVDVPSGTAVMLANALKTVREKANFVIGRGEGKREKNDIGISSVRRGNIVGIHEILISTDSETLTLRHEAHSRTLFADGAVTAAKFLLGKPAGLYTMNDMVKE